MLAQEREDVSASVGKAMSSLSDGDLTCRLADDIPGEYQQLRIDFNSSMEKLQQTVLAVSANAQAIRSGTEQIAVAADDLSHRTERQAASLEETAAALDEITATVKKTAEKRKLRPCYRLRGKDGGGKKAGRDSGRSDARHVWHREIIPPRSVRSSASSTRLPSKRTFSP